MMISHNLEHVWSLCDRFAVLRQGKLVACLNKAETTPDEIVSFVTGSRLVDPGQATAAS